MNFLWVRARDVGIAQRRKIARDEFVKPNRRGRPIHLRTFDFA